MQAVLTVFVLLAVLASPPVAPVPAGDQRVSDAEIRRRIIDDSIAAYDGPCACPYQTARNGSRCGRRSAYDRAGGEAPLCFPRDVSDDMVRSYRAEHGL